MSKWQSTKRYTPNEGLSCAFRQWKAKSHCNQLHGYALEVFITFEADELDDKNWVVDFGGIKEIKDELHFLFDHTTFIAADDPHLVKFEELAILKVIDLRIQPNVGCEAFAERVFRMSSRVIKEKYGDRCRVVSVEVREHAGNSAIYYG